MFSDSPAIRKASGLSQDVLPASLARTEMEVCNDKDKLASYRHLDGRHYSSQLLLSQSSSRKSTLNSRLFFFWNCAPCLGVVSLDGRFARRVACPWIVSGPRERIQRRGGVSYSPCFTPLFSPLSFCPI